jgi:hypothetical protein
MKNRAPFYKTRFSHSVPDSSTVHEAYQKDHDFLLGSPVILAIRPAVKSEVAYGLGERYVVIFKPFREDLIESDYFCRTITNSLSDAVTMKEACFKNISETSKHTFVNLERSVVLW